MSIDSLHIIASPTLGGAERWFLRFLEAMRRGGDQVEAIVRERSALASNPPEGVATQTAAMRSVWDPWSRREVDRLVSASSAPIVQTYMSRATRLTRIEPGKDKLHVARLGGYYGLHAFTHAHEWIGNTRGLCDWMIRQGFPSARVHHLPNFVDDPVPSDGSALKGLRLKLDLHQDDVVLLSVARFVPIKGHDTLLRAFAELGERIRGRRLRLILLGDGPLRRSLTGLARKLGITDRVSFAGWQSEPSHWYRLADVVVFPSREEEALGNVILETWSHARPLVCTAFRGARELVRDGKDGSVVPCDDVGALGNALRSLLDAPERMTELAENGRERIRHEYSSPVVLAGYRDFYRHLASRHL